jgi:hypothetical protein
LFKYVTSSFKYCIHTRVLQRPLLCPAIIERVYREPLGEMGEILFEKIMGRKRRNGGHRSRKNPSVE